MADLSKLNRNNEQRLQASSACTLMQTMPGGQDLEGGVNHIVGAIPVGALIKGWNASVNEASGWGVEVSIGTSANPTLFATALTVTSSNVNDKLAVMEEFFPNGEDIIVNVITGAGVADVGGIFTFVLDYTEVDTTCGAYTA